MKKIFSTNETGLKGNLFLTHRWQKHFLETRKGTLLAAVYHTQFPLLKGKTHIYRCGAGEKTFKLSQTLSDDKINESGDMNAGIMIEDHFGNIYATGHSIPTVWNLWYQRLPFSQTKLFRYGIYLLRKLRKKTLRSYRTNVVWVSKDDGMSWSVLFNDSHPDRDDAPHPHNLFWDVKEQRLWFLVGHDGTRLYVYDPKTEKWEDRYKGSIIESQDRLPLAMYRSDDYLWLGCEVSGPDHKHLFKSADNGKTWEQIDHHFVYPEDQNNDGIWAIDSIKQKGKEIICVAGGRPTCGYSFVKMSSDNGLTWKTSYIGEKNSDAWLKVINNVLYIADGPEKILRWKDVSALPETFYKAQKPKETALINFVEPGVAMGENTLYLIDNNHIYSLKT